jgi:hypothetical protein
VGKETTRNSDFRAWFKASRNKGWEGDLRALFN